MKKRIKDISPVYADIVEELRRLNGAPKAIRDIQFWVVYLQHVLAHAADEIAKLRTQIRELGAKK